MTNPEPRVALGELHPVVAGLVVMLVVVLAAAFVTVASLWMKAEAKAKAERDANDLPRSLGMRPDREARNAAESLREVERQKLQFWSSTARSALARRGASGTG